MYNTGMGLGQPAWNDKTTVSHSFLRKSVRTDVATMERIKVTEMPIYEERNVNLKDVQ